MSTRRSNISPEDAQKMRSQRITNNRFGEVSYGLLQIDRSFNQINDKQNELYRYFPTALFACLETWVRMAICELVNFGEPFRSNARDLMKDKKIDFDTMIEIDKDSFTIGDIVSLSQSVSKLDYIFHTMSVLLGANFPDCIEKAHDDWESREKNNSDIKPIIDDINVTCKWVKKMIVLRHVYCHETAANTFVERTEIEQCIMHTKKFIHASNNVLDNLLQPAVHLSKSEINDNARKMVDESRELLNEVVKKLSKVLSSRQMQLLAEANEAWEGFLSASVEMEGIAYGEWTIRESEEAKFVKKHIDQRIEQLNALYYRMEPIEEWVFSPKRQVETHIY